MSVFNLHKSFKKAAATALVGLSAMASGALTFAVETVDVMVLYNSSAETDRNRNGSIDTYINQLISASNTAYSKSQMNVRIRLVHSEKMDISGIGAVDGSGLTALLRNAKVKELRTKYGADLVAMLTVARSNGGGGYTCGIAYVGNGSNGQFSRSFINNYAYSLTGSDCGASTFAHELGHNMGLLHSRKQDNSGGMFEYALGHGVENQFGTIMTYPFLFNARGVEVFSNPNISICRGLPCGVASGSNSADAARAVNNVASQLAGFYPTQVTGGGGGDNGGGDNGGGDNGGSPTPSDPITEVPVINGNLISNASFEEGISPWYAKYGPTLSIDNNARFTGEASVKISNRGAYYYGAAYPLDGKLQAGTKYTISAGMKLATAGSEPGRMVIAMESASGTDYVYFDKIGVTDERWNTITGEFTFEPSTSLNDVYILFYGPAANKDFFLDQVSIVAEVVDGGGPTDPGGPDGPNPGTNLIENPGLETGTTSSWVPGYYGKILVSSRAFHDGNHSLASYDRKRWYDGPKQLITTKVNAGASYNLTAWVKMYNGNANIQARIFYRDDLGAHWIKLDEQAVNTSWSQLGASFSLDVVGELQEARLHFFGPNPGQVFYVDDVVLEQQ